MTTELRGTGDVFVKRSKALLGAFSYAYWREEPAQGLAETRLSVGLSPTQAIPLWRSGDTLSLHLPEKGFVDFFVSAIDGEHVDVTVQSGAVRAEL
jgi:hypothetical protein